MLPTLDVELPVRHLAVLELLRDLHVAEAAVVRAGRIREPGRSVLAVSCFVILRLEVEHFADLAAMFDLLLVI